MSKYPKAAKYPDLDTIYSQCSGPGGLKVAEFIADKMGVQPGKRMLDIGMNRGYQTCFLAKEYDLNIVGIDPWDDRDTERSHVDYLMQNAHKWGVHDRILGIQIGVPDTKLPSNTYNYAYSTTTLEMIRGIQGKAAYQECLVEIYRVLKPGGVFGLGEPVHYDVPIPSDLAPRVSTGDDAWSKYFVTVAETREAISKAGFEIIEADYAPDARSWWEEYADHDPFSKSDPEGEAKTIRLDDGRWLSFGYVIARKPGSLMG